MKRKILLSPLVIIILIIVFGIGVAGAAIYFGTSSGGEVNTTGINLQKGLVGWWDFNGNAKDSTANSNHGAVTGATLTTDRKGQVNKAYSFGGTGYIDAGSGIPFTTNSFTVSMWLNLASAPSDDKTLIGTKYQNDFGVKGWNFIFNGGALYFQIATTNGNTNLGVSPGFSYGSWAHYTWAVDRSTGTTVRIYKNGALLGSSSDAAVIGDVTSLTNLKFSYSSAPIDKAMVMDDVRIYNRALSTTEITALYQEYDSGIVISDLQKGLMGQWKMDGYAKDSTANSNHGAVTGATLTTDRKGQLNKAYSFNGTSDFINIGNPASVENLGDMAVCAWVKSSTDNPSAAIVSKYAAPPPEFELGSGGCLTLTGSNRCFYFRRDSTSLANYALTDFLVSSGVWNHACGISSSGSLYTYVNGVLKNSSGPFTFDTSRSDNLNIGRRAYPGAEAWWGGSIDDVRIYNRALSVTEVADLYSEYDPGIVVSDLQKGLMGWWKMDGYAKDASANSNHGTVTGATLTPDRKGQLNKAYSFNGSTDSISLGNPASLRIANTVTIAGWVYLASEPGSAIRSWFANGYTDTNSIYIGTHTSYPSSWWAMLGPTYEFTFGTKVFNQWVHLVVTLDLNLGSNQLKAYQNGVLAGQLTRTNDIMSISSTRYIGGSGTGSGWSGYLDDVRIWNRALSPAEITALYQSY